MTETPPRRRRRSQGRSHSGPSRSSGSGFGVASIAKGVLFAGICLLGAAWIIGHLSADSVPSDRALDIGWQADGVAKYLENAQSVLESTPPDFEAARADARKALTISPLNIEPLVILAETAKAQGDDATSDAFRSLVMKRSRRDIDTLRWQLDQAMNAKDYDKLVSTADALLRMDSTQVQGRYAIGILVTISSDDQARRLIIERLQATPPPTWRRPFLNTLASFGPLDSFPTIMAEIQRADVQGAGIGGWAQYLDRLMRQGDSRKAYATWAGLLPPDRLTELGYLFNGSFETEPYGLLFDWTLTPAKGVEIARVSDEASDGKSSLSVTFGGAPMNFRNVRQTLILDPGNYRFTGMVKTEDLQTDRGLSWSLYCFGGNRQAPVATSPSFSGTSDWSPFQVDFTIPATGCDYQSLRLELPARIAAERRIKGRIWIDNLVIQSLPGEIAVSAPANGGQ